MEKVIIWIVASLALCGCVTTESGEKITVASETVDCVGVAPMKCLLVKKDGSDDWSFWYTGIEGFDHEPGYEYVLRVRKTEVKNPPADASSLKYILVKIVSKVKKTSEGMPPSVRRE